MTKMNINALDFVDSMYKKSAKKARLFKSIFWALTLFTLLFGFFSALMGVAKLASSRFPNEFEMFVKLFVQKVVDEKGSVKEVDQWPIFTLWIGIAVAIINGLVGLFLVKKKWIRNKRVNNLIELELLRYKNNSPKYSKAKSKDLLLFESVNAILGNNTRLLSRGGKDGK